MWCEKRYYIPIAGALVVLTTIAIIRTYNESDFNKPDIHDPADDNKLPFENEFLRIQEEPPYNLPTFRFIRNKTEVQVFKVNSLGNNIRVYASGSEEDISIFGSTGYLKLRLIENGDGFYVYEILQQITSSFRTTSCFELHADKWSWFGGRAQQRQYWPIEKLKFYDYEYAPKHRAQINVAERYWLNSAGSFIFLRNYASLQLVVHQNILDNELCMDINERDMFFEYVIGVGGNATHAHQHATKHYLYESSLTPDPNMIRYPMWSTGERFGKNVNETAVLQYANEIEQHGFDRGQISIDDRWEGCYGTLAFDENRFPNAKNMTGFLKLRGFQVTVWIHPFVNKECKQLYALGVEKG